MDLSRPYGAVSPTLEGDALAVLANTTRPLTGREVARLARRGSQRGVLSALERLVDHGIVVRAEAGRSFQYTLDRDHLAAPAVEILAGMRSALFDRLRDLLAGWEQVPIHGSVFGSAARGDGGLTSDIDLLVVRPGDLDAEDSLWRAQLADLANDVVRWTGNHAAIAEVPGNELRRLADERSTLVDNLRADAVLLYGPEISTLVRTT
jgi:predicted nucleotidyltransferase